MPKVTGTMYPLEVISLRFKAGELTEKLLEALTKDPRVQVAKRLNVGSIGKVWEVCCHDGYLSEFVQLEPDIESDSEYAVGRRKVESLFLMCRRNPTHSISIRSDETRYSPQNHGWNECGMNSYSD